MNDRTARTIFWAGTASSLALFLVLTVDTHARFASRTKSEELTAQVISGKHAFERYNCNDCHTILGFGAYYAPDLTRAWTRIGPTAIGRRLLSPEVAFASSYRKMPNQGLTPGEAEDITAYLHWVDGIDNNDWPPQDSKARLAAAAAPAAAAPEAGSPGLALIERERCLDCHMLGGQGTPAGQRLDWIGASHGADWIARYLADPQALSPGSQMAAFDHLAPAERRTIADFLVALAPGREER